jgi:two-component system sensor histidine kinase and response regulator WspE
LSPAAGFSSVDPVFLDLFRQEMETRTAVLSDGLLSLEGRTGTAQELEALMRAAHSIKGAARIVQCDPAARLAHGMEDCFVAAQGGRLQLATAHVDVLLRGVDMLQRIARIGPWQSSAAVDPAEVEPLLGAISAILKPAPAAPPAAESPPPSSGSSAEPEPQSASPKPAPPVPPEQEPAKPAEVPGRAVRVTAQTLDRLVGLAGECLVEVGWLRSLADSLLRTRRNFGKVAGFLERLEQSRESGGRSSALPGPLLDAKRKIAEERTHLAETLSQFEMFSRRMESLAERLCGEVVTSRMRPFADGVGAFPRMVRDLARSLGKKVKLEIVGKATQVDRDILDRLEAPLNHLLRNAVDHGIGEPDQRRAAGKPEEGTVRLEARHLAGMLSISVSDDGRGIDLDALRTTVVEKNLATAEMTARMTESELLDFLFLPGFSTAKQVTEISGRGVGLDVVQSMVQDVGGSLRAVSRPGQGMTFQLQLPITLSVLRTLLVQIVGQSYAIPLARIDRLVMLPRGQVEMLDGYQYCMVDGQAVGLVSAPQILGGSAADETGDLLPVVVLSDRFSRYGLVVERFLGERDLVVRPLDPRLGKVKDVAAAAVTEDGSIVLILDVEDLIGSIDNLLAGGQRCNPAAPAAKAGAERRKRVLVVDDSLTVREVERRLLENHGYDVVTAVDGLDGWSAVLAGHFDLVISDYDMPRLNGVELVSQIRREPKLQSLPVMLVSYKDRDEDRRRGLEAGANYYLTKSGFHDETLLRAVVDLIGESGP